MKPARLGQAGWCRPNLMQNDSHWSVRLKWRMSRKKLKEQAGEGVQIGRLRHWSTLSLLGSHVFRRAQNRPGGRVVDRSRSAERDPEIGKRDAVPVANNDVGGLHIAMDNSSSMGIVQCGAHLFGDTERPGSRQRTIPRMQIRTPPASSTPRLRRSSQLWRSSRIARSSCVPCRVRKRLIDAEPITVHPDVRPSRSATIYWGQERVSPNC